MPSKKQLAFMASLGYAQQSPDAVVQSLADMGYAAVEWTFGFFNPRATSLSERQRLVAVTRDAGLEVSEVVVQQDVVKTDEAARRDAVALVLECIDAAADAGVQALNVFTGPAPWNPAAPKVPDDLPAGEAWGMVFDAFDAWVPAAEDKGVDLAVEGVWGMMAHDFYTTRFLIDRYDSPRLGVNLDPSHDVLVGNFDCGWIARQWGERIKHVHLKDAIGVAEAGKFLFPLLGEGRVDWVSFGEALDEIGYGGFMSVEFESFQYYATVLGQDVADAARISYMQACKLLSLDP